MTENKHITAALRRPFCIMSYTIEFLGIRKHVWELMVRPVPEGRGNITLSAEQANSIIDEMDLVPLAEDSENILYGNRSEDFLKKWKGFFAYGQKRKNGTVAKELRRSARVRRVTFSQRQYAS